MRSVPGESRRVRLFHVSMNSACESTQNNRNAGKRAACLESGQRLASEKITAKMSQISHKQTSLTRVSRPLMSLSIFLFPVFGSTPSCPALYLPCPCSDREIHTWRTLSVGYCMFTSRHQHVHSVPHCDSHLASPRLLRLTGAFPSFN